MLLTVTTTTNQLALDQSLQADRELQKLRPSPAAAAAAPLSFSPASSAAGTAAGGNAPAALMRLLNYSLSLGGTGATDASDYMLLPLDSSNSTSSSRNNSSGMGQAFSSRAVLGMLLGIPYGLKDVFAVPRYPTTWGLLQFRDRVISQVREGLLFGVIDCKEVVNRKMALLMTSLSLDTVNQKCSRDRNGSQMAHLATRGACSLP